MKTGNKTHVVLLILVLAGAVGYIGFEMKSHAAAAAAAQAPPAAEAGSGEKPKLVASDLPDRLYGDPFCLAKNVQIELKTPTLSTDPKKLRKDLMGDAADGWLDGGSEPITLEPAQAPAAKSQEPPPDPVLCLCGIVTAPTPIAFISIGDEQPRQFRAGDCVVGDVTVQKIEDGKVRLRLSSGSQTLAVGAKLPLKEGSDAN
ncbi:MAG TPA: hypothetical protein VMI31_19090 [Fimbriimonadaceae bacterium]|nr:hypothetical protein [Fimbriimonadaceae bacterium]